MSTPNNESRESSNGAGDLADRLAKTNLEKLKAMRKKVDLKTKRGRDECLSQLLPIIRLWKGELPDLREIFSKKEIECLLTQSTGYMCVLGPSNPGQAFFNFVIRSGYKDEPDLHEDGRPLLRRTTPVHHMTAWEGSKYVGAIMLFKIYDRFDLNYTNESGLTHFHAACMTYRYDVVEKFLEFGQDPNLIWQETGDSPLHLALWNQDTKTARLLLSKGADPNLANKRGWTSLHIISQKYKDDEDYDDVDIIRVMEMLPNNSDEKHQPLQINIQDKWGITPLHIALFCGYKKMVDFLLRNGADRNPTNANKLTPMHMICKRGKDDDLVEKFFKINQQKIPVNVEDEDGRTPLHWAVARFMPNVVESLLDHDADLPNLVFPTESHFNNSCDELRGRNSEEEEFTVINDSPYLSLEIVTRVLIVVERLEKRGFKLDRSNAITIMNVFAKQRVFDTCSDLDEFWYNEEKFVREGKKLLIDSSLAFYNLTRSQPKDAEKRLTYKDFLEFASSEKFSFLGSRIISDCVGYLCEKISRGFFRRWAFDSFLKLAPYKVSIECFDNIIKQLRNEDLRNICLAATGKSHKNKKSVKNVINCNNDRPVRTKKAPQRLQVVW